MGNQGLMKNKVSRCEECSEFCSVTVGFCCFVLKSTASRKKNRKSWSEDPCLPPFAWLHKLGDLSWLKINDTKPWDLLAC